jgi:hypothetical protein
LANLLLQSRVFRRIRRKIAASASACQRSLATSKQIDKTIIAAFYSYAAQRGINISSIFFYARTCFRNYATSPSKASRIPPALHIYFLKRSRFLLKPDFGNAKICSGSVACRQVSPRKSSPFPPDPSAPCVSKVLTRLAYTAASRFNTPRANSRNLLYVDRFSIKGS